MTMKRRIFISNTAMVLFWLLKMKISYVKLSESSTYKPEMSPFEIDKAITGVLRSLRGQIQEKDLYLSLKLCSQMVVGHKGLIVRGITNF